MNDLNITSTFDISLFEIDKEKNLVNLTKIANYFGKRVNKWTELPTTKRFLEAFAQKNPLTDNWVTVQGGNKQGTWASKKIALKFSEWISVDFEIFANEVLDNYFTPPKPKTVLENLKDAVAELERAEEENKKLALENTNLANREIEVKTQKDYKWLKQEVQNDRGRTINYYVQKHFFSGSYSEAHKKAKEFYKVNAGIALPNAKLMSLEQKKDYLEFLSRI